MLIILDRLAIGTIGYALTSDGTDPVWAQLDTAGIADDAVTIDQIDSTVAGIETGAGAPSSTPRAIGDRYIDTTAKRWYIATGTASSADWFKEGVYASGTVTVTANSGDVTVTLPWDWTGGFLKIVLSDAATHWAGSTSNILEFDSSYDALTAAGYTTTHALSHRKSSVYHTDYGKTENIAGLPKSATTTTFVLDDDTSTTVYVKWLFLRRRGLFWLLSSLKN